MRLKTIAICSVIFGASFVGGTKIGQYTVEKLKPPMPAEIAENEPEEANVSVISQNNTPESSPPKITEEKKSYLMILSDNEIRVFEVDEGGVAKFVHASPVEAEELREADYERLCRGIKVESLEEAKALAEDFGS